MLVLPGPIAPLDAAALLQVLQPEPPLAADDDIGAAFTDAADQLDATRATMGTLPSPDADDNDDDVAIDGIVSDADVVVGIAQQGAPGLVVDSIAAVDAALPFFQNNVDNINQPSFNPDPPTLLGTLPALTSAEISGFAADAGVDSDGNAGNTPGAGAAADNETTNEGT